MGDDDDDAAPVFAQADLHTLYQLQILQNTFCRRASGSPWYVWNDILHRDIELPIISKYMQDMSKKFFDIAQITRTLYYSHPYLTRHLLHTTKSEGLGMFSQAQTPPYYDLKRSLGNSARPKSPSDFLCRDVHLVAPIGQSRADGIPCRSATIDEVLKVPIYWQYGQPSSSMMLQEFFDQ
ncbi:hypothetical protein EVAR_46287_1 [Eumeta japonica]|uniref:Uncharacterized protein n=1 Tax=Eumeta variegata TaxID=151549 RepID=A0A4C1XZI9_EUMVA|nr:hypothetical protein EVAR_46287_1 [Eumeta japonica]